MKEEEGKLRALESFDIKPFAEKMILIRDIEDSAFIEAIFKNLTPEAQRTSILTGELQMLDMHAGNLGVEPVPNEEYHKFQSETFAIEGEKINFELLLQCYITGRIDDNFLVIYQGRQSPIHEIPGLSQALKVKWKLIVFDTDLSMTEGNELMQEILVKSNKPKHLIPLRSTILEDAGKDVPLSAKCLDLLKQTESTRKDLEVWMKRHDAPLWRTLSAEDREALEKDLLPVLKRYNLSKFRKQSNSITLDEIGKKFSQEISTNPSKYIRIWNRLESATVKDADTLATFAKRHKITVEELRTLNPGLREIEEGANLKESGFLVSDGVMNNRLKITDLSSTSEKAVTKRKQLAAQLFPRLTLGQQKAFTEREERLTSYLRDYEQLEIESPKLDTESLQTALHEFVKKHSSLFATDVKSNLLRSIVRADTPEKVQHVKAEILKDAQPTYFNAMKAMYPLLADSYQLIELIHPGSKYLGGWIGLPDKPLEDIINDGNKKSRSEYAADQLASRIEEVGKTASARGEDIPFFRNYQLS